METDWLGLWRELAVANTSPTNRRLADRYKTQRGKRSERPDALLSFVLQNVGKADTVLDIGAGSGRWSIPIARVAGSVTAVEPSAAMRHMLKENIDEAQVHNLRIVSSPWEESCVDPHDVVVSAHAIYSSPDFASFIRKIEQSTRKVCYLALRLPSQDGIIGELSFSIYGRYHDSPNAFIAYNALYSMGIYVNVLVENRMYCWENSSMDEAIARAKKHLRLESSNTYDGLIRDTLEKRLIVSDDRYTWPDGMRSTLLWWRPSVMSGNQSSGD